MKEEAKANELIEKLKNLQQDLTEKADLPKFNNGECKKTCNCIEISEAASGGNPVKNYQCYSAKFDELEVKKIIENK